MSRSPGSAGAWHARLFASLRVRSYRWFFYGLLFTLTGFWVRVSAVGWWVFTTTGSYERLGWIAAASLLPWVPLGPLGGLLMDRRDGRRLMMLTQVGVLLLNLAVAAALWMDRLDWTGMLVATILGGALRGVENPVRQTIARRLVGRETLANAVGLNAAAFQCTQAIGALIEGLVYAHWGPAPCFATFRRRS